MPPTRPPHVRGRSAITLGTPCSAQVSRVLRVRRAVASAARPGQDSTVARPARGGPARRRPSSGPRSTTGGPSWSPTPTAPAAWTLLIDGTAQSPRRPRRPDAPGVRVRPADRPPARRRSTRRRPRRCAVLHLGGGALTLPRYVAATRPGSRAAGRRARRRAGRAGPPPACPPTGCGLDVRVADARGGARGQPRPALRRRGARRLRRRPHPGAPDLGGVRAPRWPAGCGPAASTSRTSPTARAAHARHRSAARSPSPAARPRPPRRCSARPRSSRRRTCCTGAGSATSCWSPAAARAGRCRWPQVARRVAADPFPARVEPGAAFAAGGGGGHRRDGRPSPRPPRGLFGQ